MLQHLLNVYAMNLKRLGMHVQDLSDEQMVEQPSGVINHPAWTLGHLAATADNLAKALGLESTFPDAWREACKHRRYAQRQRCRLPLPGNSSWSSSPPSTSGWPPRFAAAPTRSCWAQPHPNLRARRIFPTFGDYAVALMTTHEANHLGQLAAWRRAMGLGSATGI